MRLLLSKGVGGIDVRFDDQRLARDCGIDTRGRRRFGDSWPPVRRRLATLDKAPTLEDLRDAPGRCHELRGDRTGSLAMRVTGNLRLVFRPDHDPAPADAQGSLVWRDVTRIVIEEVVDYHGD